MRVLLASVGRLKAGAERDLCRKYLTRAAATGRAVGLTDLSERETTESRVPRANDRRIAESDALRALLPPGGRLVALDEHGRNLSTSDFARDLAAARDAGVPAYMIAIGGPDGLDPDFLASANLTLAFGAMTWPHQLVRILVAEQIYRATTILVGHPYHRT